MVTPDREMPGMSAVHCQRPIIRALGGAEVAAPLQPLAGEEDETVDDEKDGGDGRNAEQAAQKLVEGKADDGGRDRRDDDEAEQAQLVGTRPLGRPAENREQELDPVAPEIDEERRRGAEMEDDEEGQEARRLLIDLPAQEGREDDRVTEAADREKLGDALEDGGDECLEGGHR